MKTKNKPRRERSAPGAQDNVSLVPYSDTHGIVYWKGQNTSLQGGREDFLGIVQAIRTRSTFEQKWCTAVYDEVDDVIRLGPCYITYDVQYTALALPLDVADKFATELEALAQRMK